MPKYTTLTIGLCRLDHRVYRLAYGEELMITRQNLCALLFVLREADKTSQNLYQSCLVEHPREQHIESGVAVYFALAINGLPLHKTILASGYRARFGGRHIAHHAEGVIDKERRNLNHIVSQLGVCLRHIGILARWRFQLHNHQR